jgi:uncharacterized cofD-like protein
MKKYEQKVVTFGGDTGHFHLLNGLRELNNTGKISTVVSCWDSGGSSGRLRTELGVLPPGDIRRCVLALMEDPEQQKVAQRLFDDRLEDMAGPLKGHSFGNLLTARLDNIYKGQDRGIDAERALFRVRAHVMPVSVNDVTLVAETSKGKRVVGETNIDYRAKEVDYDGNDKIVRIYFDTRADVNPEVLKVVKSADKVIFAPGDLYTSILPHLLVDGVKEAVISSKAEIIFVLNLCTKKGETEYYRASDYLKALLFYLDYPKRKITVIANNANFDKEVLKIYKGEGQELVEVDTDESLKISKNLRIVKAKVGRYFPKEHLIRHDSIRLAEAVLKI